MVVIHAHAGIDWQRERAPKIAQGLKALGVDCRVTDVRQRTDEGLAILLGTTLWRGVEDGPYLLIDRCSFGDTEQWVSLIRDGHGRRGDHRVPAGSPASRWEWAEDVTGVTLKPWGDGRRRILCGQTETWSPHYRSLDDWYRKVPATHFRRHPQGDNPTGLPEVKGWGDAGVAITLNSSIAVQAVLEGVPTVTMDEAAMAWDVTGHAPGEVVKPPRLPWLHWLAWTQWTWDEIAEGKPWAHLL